MEKRFLEGQADLAHEGDGLWKGADVSGPLGVTLDLLDQAGFASTRAAGVESHIKIESSPTFFSGCLV